MNLKIDKNDKFINQSKEVLKNNHSNNNNNNKNQVQLSYSKNFNQTNKYNKVINQQQRKRNLLGSQI